MAATYSHKDGGIAAAFLAKAAKRNAAVANSYETMNSSKLRSNMSHLNMKESAMRGSRMAGSNNSGRSFKETIKVFVQMMVEDIWAYYEGFAWQRRILNQSEQKKKKRQR